MEFDSQISGSKTLEKNSILSFKYIYKKVRIRDNIGNAISDLRTFNYEKIAKFKMKNMNLKLLLNSIFKLKSKINKNNPLLKYINYVKPYNYQNLQINIYEKPSLIDNIFKNKIKKIIPKKESILNFSSKNRNFRNFYYSRMSNIEYKKINHNRNEKIILIQKHIRGFLSKKIVDEEVNKIIAKKIIHKILIIQKAMRHFLNKKNSLSHLIINIIQNERISKSNKIADVFSLYHYRNQYKKNLIIQKIIKARADSILKIQNKLKSYIFIKKVKEILRKEKKSYVLTYPFNAETVQIKIYLSNSYKIYDYAICPVRKYFVLYIEKGSIPNSEYLCQMIVNKNIILDKRYKYIVDKNNVLYNLIYIGEPVKIEQSKKMINLEINEVKKDKKEIIDKKEKKEKKENKKKKKKNYDETDNDFFFYCYNENSNSTNSYSTKSDHEKNKLQANIEKIKKKEENILNNINKNKINDFLKPNKEKYDKIPKNPKSKFLNFMDLNTGNITRNQIFIKNYDFGAYYKKFTNKNQNKFNHINRTYLYENLKAKNEGSIQSQKIKYNNILDELSPSISSSSRSNFSMKNLNSYSKKTHQAKFCSNHSVKGSSNKASFDIPNSTKNKTFNTSFKIKRNKIKK
jgi:hypothetical protein